LPRLRSRQALPAPSAQAARAWHTEHLPCHGFRGARCSTASTRAASATAVGLTMKLVAKPDAGNLHVRFDERGQETECCYMDQATAPVLDSTRRREFITLIGAGAASWPLTTRAQQSNPVRLGFLPPGLPSNPYDRSLVEAFQRGLRRVGLIENRDIVLDVVWNSDD